MDQRKLAGEESVLYFVDGMTSRQEAAGRVGRLTIRSQNPPIQQR